MDTRPHSGAFTLLQRRCRGAGRPHNGQGHEQACFSTAHQQTCLGTHPSSTSFDAASLSLELTNCFLKGLKKTATVLAQCSSDSTPKTSSKKATAEHNQKMLWPCNLLLRLQMFKIIRLHQNFMYYSQPQKPSIIKYSCK